VFLLVISTLNTGEVLQGAGTPRGLGTVEILSGPVQCEGGDCYEIQVTCPEVGAPARARLKVGTLGDSSPRGTILFTTGGLGTGWYEAGAQSRRILTELSAAGFRTVQLQWIDSWLLGSSSKEEGHVRLAVGRPRSLGGCTTIFTSSGRSLRFAQQAIQAAQRRSATC
jgi:hypothetical protein